MNIEKQKAQYDNVRKEIKDLLYEPCNYKFANYTGLEFATLVLIALDLIFDRISKLENRYPERNDEVKMKVTDLRKEK